MPELAEVSSSNTGYFSPIQITNASGAGDYYDFTVEIKLDSTWGGWNYLASTDGSDIYFVDDGGDPLYFYLEEFDASSKIGIAWVKIPKIADGETKTIYMMYGAENPYSNYNDPTKAFLFYDGFDTDTVNSGLWKKYYDATDFTYSYSISASVLNLTMTGAGLNPSGWRHWGIWTTVSLSNSIQGIRVVSKAFDNDGVNTYLHVFVFGEIDGLTTVGQGYNITKKNGQRFLVSTYHTDLWNGDIECGDGTTAYSTGQLTVNVTGWLVHDAKMTNSSWSWYAYSDLIDDTGTKFVDIDSSSFSCTPSLDTVSSLTILLLQVQNDTASHTVRIDDIRVMNWGPNPPTYSIGGVFSMKRDIDFM